MLKEEERIGGLTLGLVEQAVEVDGNLLRDQSSLPLIWYSFMAV